MQRSQRTILLVFLLVAMLLLCAGCAGKTADPGKTGESAELVEPKNEDVKIETPYCTLTIPFAFSELVAVDHQQKDTIDSYVFSAALEDKKVPVYTISFVPDGAEAQGELFGTIKGKNGNVKVIYSATDPDKTLDEDALESFYTAQETINDVFASLQASTGFSAA